ncbi:MAG: hypothetical protein ACREOQ_03165 [Gemmatimonadales bacterium]
MDPVDRAPDRLVLLIDEAPITRNLLQPVVRPFGLEIAFRIFLPGLATVCLTAGSNVGGGGGCLAKPPRSGELRTRIAEVLAGEPMPASIAAVAPDVVARARSAFALSASLLDAARELARGMPGESAIGS